MRSFTVALVVCVVVAASGQAAPGRHGSMRRWEIDAPALGDRHRAVRVWLPPSYSDSASRERRYPVIVMLHGWPGSDGNWLSMGHAGETADTLIATGRMPEAILVFPNGAGKGLLGRSLWANSADGSSRLEDFLTADLPRWVDSTFRTDPRPARRGVIGLSDGGTAAIMLLLRHGEVYGGAASHSGTFCLRKDFGMGGIAGPEPGDTAWLARQSPAVAIERGALPPPGATLYVDCGERDESLADNRAFHLALEARGIAHEYHEFPGTHDWSFWRAHLARSLEAIASGWK